MKVMTYLEVLSYFKKHPAIKYDANVIIPAH